MKFSQLIAAVLTGLVCLCPPARAQDHYPTRLITVIAPITAGTTIDILARLYADRLSKRFGQQVVVVNRPGAGGLIAAQAVASSPPDGYTLIFVNSGHTILGALNKNLPFDPVRDFAGVSLVGEAPTISDGTARPRRIEPEGIRRTGEGQARHHQLRIGRYRYRHPPRGCVLRAEDRHRPGPYSIHRQRHHHCGHAGRAYSGVIRSGGLCPAAASGRTLARPGGVRHGAGHRSDQDSNGALAGNRLSECNLVWHSRPGQDTESRPPRVSSQAISEVGKDPALQAKIRAQGIDPRDIELEKFDLHIQADMARLDPLLKAIADQR